METLKTEDDYREALIRFLEICDASEDAPEANELEQIVTSMEIYENKYCS